MKKKKKKKNSLVDYATGNVCANFHGDCAIDGRDLRGGLIQPPPPPQPQNSQKSPAWLGLNPPAIVLNDML